MPEKFRQISVILFLLFYLTGDLIIEPGTYIYTFQCLLPMGLPTSFEGPYGHIRYSAIVTLDRPRWPDQVYEQDFTVIKPLNLNNDVTLRVRIFDNFFSFSCFFVIFLIRFFNNLTNFVIHYSNQLYEKKMNFSIDTAYFFVVLQVHYKLLHVFPCQAIHQAKIFKWH